MTTQKIKAVISNKGVQVTVSAVISGIVSGAASHFVTKKRITEEYRIILEKEITEARRFYSTLNKRDAFSSPDLVMQEVGLLEQTVSLRDAAEALTTYKGLAPQEEISSSIFLDNVPMLDPEAEQIKRDDGEPYLITEDEFRDSSLDYTQVTVTYYEDDCVLADDKDELIENHTVTVGKYNLFRFGVGSNDSNVLYVRNDELDIDFEIIRHSGNYGEVVHGIVKRPKRRT